MRTILNLQKNGIEKLSLKNPLEGPLKSYLDLAVEMLNDGQPKEISDLVLSVEYDSILQDKDLDVNSIMCLRAIK